MGGAMPTFDVKAEHEKATAEAKNKAKKLFGDAKERSAAKKIEKQKAQEAQENDEDEPKKVRKKPKESITQMMMKAELNRKENEAEIERIREEKRAKAAEAVSRNQQKRKRILTTNDRYTVAQSASFSEPQRARGARMNIFQ